MLRSDIAVIEAYMRSTSGKPSLANLSRGYMLMDSADLDANVADGKFVGTCLGFRITRSAALDSGVFQYKNHAGSTLLTNA